MNSILGGYRDYLTDHKNSASGVAEDIVDFLKYQTIRELCEVASFKTLLENDRVSCLSLYTAFKTLYRNGIRFVLIMDEWDLFYREFRDDTALLKKFIDLLRDLFKSADGQKCFYFAYLTGILPIIKDNSESSLNTFDECTMLNPEPLERFFGFTEEDVQEIVRLPFCRLDAAELREWYEGYKLNGVDIYNPNSVVNAVMKNKCRSYWSGTRSSEEVIRLINLNFRGIKEDILKLLNGDPVYFTSGGFKNDMTGISSKDDVLSLLACLGYIACTDQKTEAPNGRRKIVKSAFVPNEEIRENLDEIIEAQDWYDGLTTLVRRSHNLYQAILDLDGKRAAAIIQEIHNSPDISLLSCNSEESLTYCVMSGLSLATVKRYKARREEQSGKGRLDLVYEPLQDPSVAVILIEFKYGVSAEEAIKQIKGQEYYREYLDSRRSMIIAGINYNPKTKKHECLIEKMTF